MIQLFSPRSYTEQLSQSSNPFFFFWRFSYIGQSFPGGSDGKESACSAGDWVQFLGWEEDPSGEESGYPLQYSCLENSMDRGAWRATIHGVAKGQTQLSD